MTKYCPLCESEFQDEVAVCTDDGEALLNAPIEKIRRAEAVDVYAAANEVEAKFIVEFLGDEGVSSQLFRPQISQFPGISDTHFIVAVKPEKKALALEAISKAREDGIISDTGLFL